MRVLRLCRPVFSVKVVAGNLSTRCTWNLKTRGSHSAANPDDHDTKSSNGSGRETSSDEGTEEVHDVKFNIKSEKRSYDIVIAGGGMVGAAMACALGSNPLFGEKEILILEAAKELKTDFSANSQYSNHVSSITPGSRRMFEKIGVWQHIEEMRYKPYSMIHVWDACGSGSITFDAEEMSQNADEDWHSKNLAYIIENHVILSALYKELKEMGDLIEINYGKRIEGVITPQTEDTNLEYAEIQLDDGEKIETKLLIAADGANSAIRNKLRMKYTTTEYDQLGVVATLRLDKAIDNNTAWQRFLPTGPIASLPLSETKSSLVWSTSPSHAKELLKLSDERFVDAVNNAFWEDNPRDPIVDTSGRLLQNVIGTLSPGSIAKHRMLAPPVFKKVGKGSRAAFPLGIGHATHYVKNRVALIGDAAHRVHPLAGQGVNLGFADAMVLTKALATSVETGEDVGHLEPLLQYETERQREVLPMMVAIDSLKRLFSSDATPLVLARTLGLQATDALTPLKEQIMAFATK